MNFDRADKIAGRAPPNAKPKRKLPLSITVMLGGRLVEIMHCRVLNGPKMLVSTDLFDAILEETGHGKASQKAKT